MDDEIVTSKRRTFMAYLYISLFARPMSSTSLLLTPSTDHRPYQDTSCQHIPWDGPSAVLHSLDRRTTPSMMPERLACHRRVHTSSHSSTLWLSSPPHCQRPQPRRRPRSVLGLIKSGHGLLPRLRRKQILSPLDFTGPGLTSGKKTRRPQRHAEDELVAWTL